MSRSSSPGSARPSPPPGCWPRCCSPTSWARPSGPPGSATARWRELLQVHDDLGRRLVEEWGGRVVKTTGDGLLASFDGPGRAIACAVALRDQVGDIDMAIRAGLHAGEVELRDGDLGGIAVHIAARIMAEAAPGEVLVSRTVRDLVAGSDRVLTDRGSHRLKGVDGDWELFAVADAGGRTGTG